MRLISLKLISNKTSGITKKVNLGAKFRKALFEKIFLNALPNLSPKFTLFVIKEVVVDQF